MSTAEETWGSVYYREKYEKPELERLRVENERLRALVECLLDNDPDEPIADNGMTVIDGWRIEARRALGRLHVGAAPLRSELS